MEPAAGAHNAEVGGTEAGNGNTTAEGQLEDRVVQRVLAQLLRGQEPQAIVAGGGGEWSTSWSAHAWVAVSLWWEIGRR